MEKFILVLSLLTAVFLYGSFLNRTPVHLNQDELGFSLNAYSISQSLHDENGRFLPLYFWHLGQMWATPIIVYIAAIFLKTFPLNEIVIRLPSVLIGIINIILIYFLAKVIFKNKFLPIICSVILALTPAHFIHSRILMDTIFIVPFVLSWLLFLLLFLKNKKIQYLLAVTFCLGIGFHSYHAAKIMMPFYFLLTIFLLHLKGLLNRSLLAISFAGFTIPILPLIPWLSNYPDTLSDQMKYIGIYNPLSLFTLENISHRLNVFVSFFNLEFLFWRGDQSIIHSTWENGVFLLPLLIFIPLGIYRAFRKEGITAKLLVVLFFTSPLAVSVAGDHFRISRSLTMLPFVAILATSGIQYLLQQKKFIKMICIFLMILIPLQFGYFLYDYLGDYRIRSFSAMKYNLPGVLEKVIMQDSSEGASKIYLDQRIDLVEKYWKFYLIKSRKEILVRKTAYFDPKTVVLDDLEKKSIIVYSFNDIDGQKDQIGPFKKTDTIYEPDRTSSFYIFRN